MRKRRIVGRIYELKCSWKGHKDIRPEEQSESADSCREKLWNEIQLKGPTTATDPVSVLHEAGWDLGESHSWGKCTLPKLQQKRTVNKTLHQLSLILSWSVTRWPPTRGKPDALQSSSRHYRQTMFRPCLCVRSMFMPGWLLTQATALSSVSQTLVSFFVTAQWAWPKAKRSDIAPFGADRPLPDRKSA